MRDLAREVAGDAQTQYATVNRIEAYLRRSYVYDEAPPYPTSRPDGARPTGADVPPPLADFLLNSRRGFCQHFAGGMAVMLRSLGIPARVAIGYTGGRFDAAQERYVVLDRDAHSWVEVWFPGYGWLPFDPTPGRSAPNPASVSSPDYAPTPFEVDLGGLVDAAVDPGTSETPSTPDATTTTPEATTPDAAVRPAPGRAAAAATGAGCFLAPLGLLLVAPGARMARRARARRRGDERERVIAAARELETSLRGARLGAARHRLGHRARRGGPGPDRHRPVVALPARRRAPATPPTPPGQGEAAAAWRDMGSTLRAIRRRAPLRRRVASALGLRRSRAIP